MSQTFVIHSPAQAMIVHQTIMRHWEDYKRRGRPLVVIVAPTAKQRSSEQNKRLYAIEAEVAKNAWVEGKQYSPENWHEHFIDKFAPLTDGVSGPRRKRTHEMEVPEMVEYQNEIEAYVASELAIELVAPDPFR